MDHEDNGLSLIELFEGNALTITIMDGIGMAVGSLLWNTVTCIIGWAVSRFGLFGSLKKVPYDNVMNIIGVVVVCIGMFLCNDQAPSNDASACSLAVVGGIFYLFGFNRMKMLMRDGNASKPEQERTVPTSTRITAILLTIVTGCLYGNMMTPMNYLIMQSGTSGDSLTYTTFFFSFCIGALVTSTTIFTCYSLYRRNRPFINPELTVPSLSSGLMYGTATFFFFSANQHLDPIVAYPILAKAPGIVCSVWAILLFKEIKGRWDVLHLTAGICVTLIGITLITVSKVKL